MKSLFHYIERLLKIAPFYFGVIVTTYMVGELYPFSYYSMFDSFPNWSYTFFLTDEKDEQVKEINTTHDGISHLYNAAFEQLENCEYGNGTETPAELQDVGENIIKAVINVELIDSSINEIRLNRIFNYFNMDNILHIDTSIIAIYYDK